MTSETIYAIDFDFLNNDSFQSCFVEEYIELISPNFIKFKTKAEIRKCARNKPRYSEIHHIMPVCLGGSDDITNLVVLNAYEHIRAHYLLHKIFKIDSLTYAFNQMRRGIAELNEDELGTIFSLYASERENIIESISKINIGRFDSHSEEKKAELRNATSERMKGKIPVFNNITQQSEIIVATNFNKQIHSYFATGTKRTEETKQKMRNSGSVDIRGIPYKNTETNEIKYFRIGDKIPDGFKHGNGNTAEHTKNTQWVTNGELNKRIQNGEIIPDGYRIGRTNKTNPFSGNKILKHAITGEKHVGNNRPPFYVYPVTKFIITFKSLDGIRYATDSLYVAAEKLEVLKGMFDTTLLNPEYAINNRTKNSYLKENHFGERFIDIFSIKWVPLEIITQEFVDETNRTHIWI